MIVFTKKNGISWTAYIKTVKTFFKLTIHIISALLTYSNKEDINKIIDILKKPSFMNYGCNFTIVQQTNSKKAYSNNSAEKLKLLKLAYKTSKDIFVLEDIFNELAKQNKDEFFKELDAFLKEENLL